MNNEIYLSELSQRDCPWDLHRWQSELVAALYRLSSDEAVGLHKYAKRIDGCSQLLDFVLKSNDVGEVRLKLQEAWFCRVRSCSVCIWRRSMMWRARFYNAVPRVMEAYPEHRFIFLTLTLRNCDLEQLRSTIQLMVAAWKRLAQSKEFRVVVGFVRSLEVTRNPQTDQAHPHFHCLLMVPGSYFKSREYLSKARWGELWARSLRIDYQPGVHVRALKPRPGVDGGELAGLEAALRETLKYSVKPGDLIGGAVLDERKNLVLGDQRNQVNALWLHEFTKQMHNVRATSVGGILRQFIAETDPEDLIHPEGQLQEEVLDDDIRLFFGWRDQVKRYVQRR